MPRTHDAHWVGFQATAREKAKLDNYCKRMQQSKTQVLRMLISQLEDESETNDSWANLPKAKPNASRTISSKLEIREWLKEITDEADLELQMAQQLRVSAEQTLAIAKHLEER